MSQILTFPRSLRSSADDKMPHIGFSLTGKHKPTSGTEIERIHLFIPSGIQTKDGASFSGMDMGAINSGSAVADRFSKGETLESILKSEDNSNPDGMIMAMKAIGKIPGTEDMVAKEGMKKGILFNPQTTLAFDGVELRTFDFAFKMVPESKEEAEDSRKIVNFFRKYLYPEKIGVFALKYPPKFKIQFFIGEEENKFMPMIHDCFLNGVQESQNPDGNSFFIDGQPTAVELSLSFSEVKQLTRHDLYNDSIGSEDPSFDYSRPGSYNNASSAGKSG